MFTKAYVLSSADFRGLVLDAAEMIREMYKEEKEDKEDADSEDLTEDEAFDYFENWFESYLDIVKSEGMDELMVYSKKSGGFVEIYNGSQFVDMVLEVYGRDGLIDLIKED